MKEEYLQEFAAEHKFAKFFYTSAKKDFNVSTAIFALVHEIVKREAEGTAMKPMRSKGSFALTNRKTQ